jgi:folate-binding protein YgfZ
LVTVPDKLNAVSDTTFEPGAIAHAGILALGGRDALAFCQAQFMNDVAPLVDGQWQWSGWLSAKGRVQALFALIRIDSETIWLWLPDGDPGQLAESLGRFVFRSKATLRPFAAMATLDGQTPPAESGRASMAILGSGRTSLDFSGAGGSLWLHLDTSRPPGAPDPAADALWRLHAIRHGLPRIAAAMVDSYTPHMLSLDRLAAFSVRKGCYPGQEIVSRTHFLGQSKRSLVRLRAGSVIESGAEIRDNERVQGSVLNAAPVDDDGFEAIAVLPTGGPPTFQCGDARLVPLPLLEGLRRLSSD